MSCLKNNETVGAKMGVCLKDNKTASHRYLDRPIYVSNILRLSETHLAVVETGFALTLSQR